MITEINGRWTCTKCGYEWSACISDDQVPEVCECEKDETWIDKHSVNCYFCGELFDERECIPADEYNDNDGGDICPDCLKEIQRRDEKNGVYPEKWDDAN